MGGFKILMSTKKTTRALPKKMTISAPKTKTVTYEKDFYKWTKDQSLFLKKEEFTKLDIEHLIEEIESLGRSEKRTLKSHLEVLLMHMLKSKYQPKKHTKSWDLSIKNSRYKTESVLKDNPSLKPQLKEILKEAYFAARLDAALETGLEEKVFPEECPWKLEDILPVEQKINKPKKKTSK